MTAAAAPRTYPEGTACWIDLETPDATAVAVLRSGGTVVSTADDEWTRNAVVRDPTGAELALSQFAPQDW